MRRSSYGGGGGGVGNGSVDSVGFLPTGDSLSTVSLLCLTSSPCLLTVTLMESAEEKHTSLTSLCFNNHRPRPCQECKLCISVMYTYFGNPIKT